ncbi:MAG: hypothetical protein U5L02_11260 [Rheinheimera sp.]|nr:hypothetical protein [Rheinheimera sp.]
MQVAFYQGRKRLANRVIADLTGGPFSHVEAVLQRYPNGWALCVSASMMDGGVRVKMINIATKDWVLMTVDMGIIEDDAWQWLRDRRDSEFISQKMSYVFDINSFVFHE